MHHLKESDRLVKKPLRASQRHLALYRTASAPALADFHNKFTRMNTSIVALELVVAVAVYVGTSERFARASIPAHLLGHPVISIDQLIPTTVGAELNAILRDLKEYPTNLNADLKTGFAGSIEEVGEVRLCRETTNRHCSESQIL